MTARPKRSNKEKVVLVDKDDKKIGLEEKVKAHKHPVALHRAISVIILDRDRILLQKRSAYKPAWPLFWSNTCCTHPRDGESKEACAMRRLKEEMGFSTAVKPRFKFIYKAKYDDTFGEHELDTVLVGEYSGPIKPDNKEVAEYKWVKISELKKDLKENPQIYTPWFKRIFSKMKF